VYSDNEDGSRPGVIDIEGVSALSESAPTSVYRERDLDGGKAKAKEMEKAKLKDLKKRRKAERAARAAAMAAAAGAGAGPEVHGSELLGVKAEPVSPVRPGAVLPDPNAGVPPPLTRVGDEMIPADESQDRDADGRRVRALTTGTDFTDGTPESQEVNAAHAVDLSESESEDEEDDMEGDFVFVEGMGNPEDKLFTFQFPSNMPKFVAPAPPAVPADADGDVNMAAELKPEVKPSPAQLRRRKHNAALPPPEGRIGTLVVMKSGKVKMVMGEGANAIVMNVSCGVSTELTSRSPPACPPRSSSSSCTSTKSTRTRPSSAKCTSSTPSRPTWTVCSRSSSSTTARRQATASASRPSWSASCASSAVSSRWR